MFWIPILVWTIAGIMIPNRFNELNRVYNVPHPETVFYRPNTRTELKLPENAKAIAFVEIESGTNRLRVKRFETGRRSIALTLADYPSRVRIIATDISNRRFELGTLQSDTNAPKIEVFAQSPRITRGGSGVLVFGVSDEGVKSVTVRFGAKRVIAASRYRKDGIYIVFCVWEMTERDFQATVEAIDKAGNIAMLPVRFETSGTVFPTEDVRFEKNYIESKKKEIKAPIKPIETPTNRLLKQPSAVYPKPIDLQRRFGSVKTSGVKDSKDYAAVNASLADLKEESVVGLSRQTVEETVTNAEWTAFRPLASFRVSSEYGLLRRYYYVNVLSRTSVHMGLDMANLGYDRIYASNPGVVAYAGYNGSAGITMMIDHGAGVYTVYFHCSELYYAKGESVKRGTVIGRTGSTGAATGDHLHFGTLIQGAYANPNEWMDPVWVYRNIASVVRCADRKIEYYFGG